MRLDVIRAWLVERLGTLPDTRVFVQPLAALPIGKVTALVLSPADPLVEYPALNGQKRVTVRFLVHVFPPSQDLDRTLDTIDRYLSTEGEQSVYAAASAAVDKRGAFCQINALRGRVVVVKLNENASVTAGELELEIEAQP